VDSTELGWDDIKFTPFTNDELYLLNLFHEKVAQIASSSFIKNGAFKSAFTFYADKSKNKFSLSHLGPEEADVRSILVLVRPVTLLHEKEDVRIRIERILDKLYSKSANDKTRQYLQSLKRGYNDKSNESKITLRGLYGEYNEDDVVDLWVNGFYFHNDSSKRKELDDLMRWPGEPVLKSILPKMIIDSCNWAKVIDDIIVNAILSR